MDTLNKIEFDGINFLTIMGILNMCENPAEFVSFYENSVIGEFADYLSYQRMFFMNGSERVIMFDNLLDDEGINRDCSLGTSSKLKSAFLNPPYASKYKGLKNILKRRTRSREKRLNFYGFFSLYREVKHKLNQHDDEAYFRFLASSYAYVENNSVGNNFYTLLKENELHYKDLDHQLRPNSIFSYTLPDGQKSGLFYFEDDIKEIFKVEKVPYKIIDTELIIENGVVLYDKYTGDEDHFQRAETKLLTMPISTHNKSIRSKDDTFLILIYVLQDLILDDLFNHHKNNKELLDALLVITKKTQLAIYLSHDAHPDIDGLSFQTIKNVFAMVDRLSEYKSKDSKFKFLLIIRSLKDLVLKIIKCINKEKDKVGNCSEIFSIATLGDLSEYLYIHELIQLEEMLSDLTPQKIEKIFRLSLKQYENQ